LLRAVFHAWIASDDSVQIDFLVEGGRGNDVLDFYYGFALRHAASLLTVIRLKYPDDNPEMLL